MTDTSNLSKYYQKSREERLTLLEKNHFLTPEASQFFKENHLLSDDVANHLIENQIGQFPLPFGVGLNFIVDGVERIIPMVTEEPSVIAACSNAAKSARLTGGFTTTFEERLQTGQMIFYGLSNFEDALILLNNKKNQLIALANQTHPSIVKRGGGVKDIEFKIINDSDNNPQFLTVYLFVDVQEAMGANIVNTILEGTTPIIQEWLGAENLMSILSNYNDRAVVTSTCSIPVSYLTTDTLSGIEVAKKIVLASDYATLDPYRAVTHNKGIMNGVDAVVMATGNDYRAIEAGAHAYASKKGTYQSLSSWHLSLDQTMLVGTLKLPMLIGSLGGAINSLPLAQLSQQLLKTNSAEQIARVIVSVGLAQNFAALKALVTEGIQKGHMSLHANALAIHAGAEGDLIPELASKLRKSDKMSLALAKDLLSQLKLSKKLR